MPYYYPRLSADKEVVSRRVPALRSKLPAKPAQAPIIMRQAVPIAARRLKVTSVSVPKQTVIPQSPMEHPIEQESFPTSPKVEVTAPQPTQGTAVNGRGMYAPVPVPGGPAGGVMVDGGDNRVYFDRRFKEVMDRVDQCCQEEGGACDFVRPGIIHDTCVCESVEDPNSVEGRASFALLQYTKLAQYDMAAARDYLKSTFGPMGYSSAPDWQSQRENAAILQIVQSGIIEKDFADFFKLCWPVQAKYLGKSGGLYKDGANLALSSLFSVRMLSEMAFEIASAMTQSEAAGPSGAQPAPRPTWPLGDTRSAATFAASLAVANNIIANYLTLMRAIEAQTVRARDTLRICQSRLQSGAPSEPGLITRVSGYSRRRLGHINPCYGPTFHLGAVEPPRSSNRPVDAMFFAMYYLSHFPAIYVLVPDQPVSASVIATEVNRRLEEIVSYSRTLREELRQLSESIQQCEQGIAGGTPTPTPPPPGGVPNAPAVDPNQLDHLPNPYEAGVLPGGAGIEAAGGGVAPPPPTPAASSGAAGFGTVAAIVAGVLLLKGRNG